MRVEFEAVPLVRRARYGRFRCGIIDFAKNRRPACWTARSQPVSGGGGWISPGHPVAVERTSVDGT